MANITSRYSATKRWTIRFDDGNAKAQTEAVAGVLGPTFNVKGAGMPNELQATSTTSTAIPEDTYKSIKNLGGQIVSAPVVTAEG